MLEKDSQKSIFSTDDGFMLPDASERLLATHPSRNIVLEASAGTGKTSVLVSRYLNLLRAGVDPGNVLAITFTRQAAAEMRERIVKQLRDDAAHSGIAQAQWNDLRDRLGDISISTVDAFCLSLLREFPLEADLDPGFGMADEIEVPRLIEAAVDRTLVIGSTLATRDSGISMLLAQLGPSRSRAALTALLNRRLVVPSAFQQFLSGVPRDLSGEALCQRAVRQIADRLGAMSTQVEQLLTDDALSNPHLAILARDLEHLIELQNGDAAVIRAWLDRMRTFFLTQRGTPRSRFPLPETTSDSVKNRYRKAARALASVISGVLQDFDRDMNFVMVRAVQVLFGVAVSEYQRSLESRSLLDFSEVLRRSVDLMRQMDEFSRSRYRLESRYHHVLVDEFQDINRKQWELISLLVQSWGEGSGLVHEAPLSPTIFVVGDRKQSIYRFRDADGSVFGDAADQIARLRDDGSVVRSIAYSFRAVPDLLIFFNDLFAEVPHVDDQRNAFRFLAKDQFPVDLSIDTDASKSSGNDALGLVVAEDVKACAETIAKEIENLIEHGYLCSRENSARRQVRPGDVAILFQTRKSHLEFERALERRAIPNYVYKGLGFFDTDEIKDIHALIRYFANPWSELRAAAFLRSRFVRLSDPALMILAGQLSQALLGSEPANIEQLDGDDRRMLDQVRLSVAKWVPLVDRLPPAELLGQVIQDSAYAAELCGPRANQARENIKKIRSIVRRLQNRGYSTMSRVANFIDHLPGDISSAVIEAFDAVNLMTVHAAKGLEFSVVFLVDIGRGTGMHAPPVRVITDRGDGRPSVAVWPYRTEAEEDEYRCDVEETKRLLYVATTRARDRLYLSTVLNDGCIKFNRGSFGEILPSSFAKLFEEAGNTSKSGHVIWQADSGKAHSFRVYKDNFSNSGNLTQRENNKSLSPPGIALEPLLFRPHLARRSVTVETTSESRSCQPEYSEDADRLRDLSIGTLVHLLIQRNIAKETTINDLLRQARIFMATPRLLRLGADADVVETSVELYVKLQSNEAVKTLTAKKYLFEVPFSHLVHCSAQRLSDDDKLIRRGTIDCLVQTQDGRIIVLEFKTGRARPGHERQLELYVAATRDMFPNNKVEGRLVYPL